MKAKSLFSLQSVSSSVQYFKAETHRKQAAGLTSPLSLGFLCWVQLPSPLTLDALLTHGDRAKDIGQAWHRIQAGKWGLQVKFSLITSRSTVRKDLALGSTVISDNTRLNKSIFGATEADNEDIRDH